LVLAARQEFRTAAAEQETLVVLVLFILLVVPVAQLVQTLPTHDMTMRVVLAVVTTAA
jgi:hypothetical protein